MGAENGSTRMPQPLRSARLVYEPLGPQHAPGLFVALGDPRVWEHLPGVKPVRTVEELARTFARRAAGPPAEREGEAWVNYSVALADDPRVPIGRIEATIHASDVGSWGETAYLFNPSCWGRGLAAEAMSWLHAELASRGVRELWVAIAPTNARSLALARRLGYREASSPGLRPLGSFDPGDVCLKLEQ